MLNNMLKILSIEVYYGKLFGILLHNVRYKNMYFCLSCMQIIVLEDTKEYIGYAPKEETKAQDRRAFDLLVCPYKRK